MKIRGSEVKNTDVLQAQKGSFTKVEESQYDCPICGGPTCIISSHINVVMDGNNIYYCIKDKNHRFWQNARTKGDILFENPNATRTNFNYNRKWVMDEEGNWKEE